ncbi:MAG: NAD-dependent epimerase/dehydratase family protein [Caldicoprobacterales bacterium]
MKSILVTGSNGFLGQQVVKELLNEGYIVTGISIDKVGKFQHKNYKYISADLTRSKEVERIFRDNEFSHVIHLAAIAHVFKGKKISWSRYYRINTIMSRQIFECASKYKIPIFFASTVDVYGIQTGEIDENTKPNPIGSYAKSKVLAEKALIEIADQPYLIARFAPIYTESNKKDIYKRYYIQYPRLAYLINKDIEYEFLSSDTAVSVIMQWVKRYDSLYGIINIVDKQSYNTKKLLEKDIHSGINPIVLRIPNILYNLMILSVNMIFYKLPFYKFSAYKILKPMKFDKKKMLKNFKL